MDADRDSVAAERAKGSVAEAIGKLTGSAGTQAEGAAQRAAGGVRGASGEAASTSRRVADAPGNPPGGAAEA